MHQKTWCIIFINFDEHITLGAVIIGLGSIFLLILLKLPFAKKNNFIPIPLIVVFAGISLNTLFTVTAPHLSLSSTQLVNILSNIFAQISFPDFSKLIGNWNIIRDGILIGMLATLETLLCIEAVDKLDSRNRITPVNRELVAQGIGNFVCGLLGAIPITAVVVRGAANVDAGGRTKLSSFTHGLFLLLAVLFIPFMLNKIPYACLAAILLSTGYKLTKPKLYRNMWYLGWKQLIPFLITIVVILFTDLLIGVSIGLLISIYFIIRVNFKTAYKISTSMQGHIEVYNIKLNSNVTFLNKVKLREALDQIPEYSMLTIDGSECHFIDDDILEIISEYNAKASYKHIELTLLGIEKVNIAALH